MARLERKHEILDGPLSDDLIGQRAAEGWRPMAIVWERESTDDASGRPEPEPLPYGLRVAADCRHLEQDENEVATMIAMLKMIVDETPFAEIARILNAQGMHARNGLEWNQTSVFYMLPRLIEVAPDIYSSQEWHQLRLRLETAGA